MRTLEKSARGAAVLIALLAAPVSAQVTQRVSVDSAGAQANGYSFHQSMSPDGRYVAIESGSSNLVPGDTNGLWDVFVRDVQLGLTELVSVDSGGAQGTGGSSGLPSISADGRYVAFGSDATNLVQGDTNGYGDVFVRDRQQGLTERVSVGPGGVQGDGYTDQSSISADGRYVAFGSRATNFVPGDTNGAYDVFVRDRQLGLTERVSVGPGGAQGNSDSRYASISADGRYVAFWSDATNLVQGDTNGWTDIFVRDRQLGLTERVSLGSGGAQGNGDSEYPPSISADERYVAFLSYATNLVAGDTNGFQDVFVRDRQLGLTERASLDSGGVQGNAHSYDPSISADGRCVAFESSATNLVPGDTNGFEDEFVRDRQLGLTERVSVDSGGAQGNNGGSWVPSISADGRYVAFPSASTNLVPGDTNATMDVFIRDRGPGTPGVDTCQAGTGGVIPCPCSNPPANAPRGCDNSAGTGGAQLTSQGAASLANDTLVFVSNGERPTATSIVLQGTQEISGGVAFGQGVRCVSGSLKRLYVKTASGGSISAPGPGDLSVSARSAALGDTISAGTSRWYAVYYRDPIVLGGCGALSTFNVTQTQLVAWGN